MVICKFYQQGTCRYGNNCSYEHIYRRHEELGFGESVLKKNVHFMSGRDYSQNQNSITSKGDRIPQEIEETMQLVQKELKASEKGNQWPLSCFSPFKERPCLPDWEDHSPDELRWMMYQAIQTGSVEECKQKIKLLYDTVQRNRSILMNPSPEVYRLIEKIYRGQVNDTPSLSFAQNERPGVNNTSIFGNTAVFGGVQAQQSIGGSSIFGAGQSQQSVVGSSIFGGGQAQQSVSGSSIFGGGQAQQSVSGSSIFGGGQAQQSVGGSSIFGGGQAQQSVGGSSIFGGVQAQQSVGGSALFGGGQAQQSVGGSALFGGGQWQQNVGGSSIFSGGQQSPSGQGSVNNFTFSLPQFGSQQSNNQAMFGTPGVSLGGNNFQKPGLLGNAPAQQVQSTNLFGSSPTQNTNVNTGSMFGGSTGESQQTTGLFGPQMNLSAFGPKPGFQAAQTTATPSLFAPQNNSIFGSPENASTQSSSFDDTIYTPLSELTEEQIAQFTSPTFTLGKIPTVPPPKEFCF